MFQGMGAKTDVLNHDFHFCTEEVNHLFLSHAHIDHSGLTPKLVKEGFSGRIFCTTATKDLTEILLNDSAEIQMQEAHFVNKKRSIAIEEAVPLYTVEDVSKAMELF